MMYNAYIPVKEPTHISLQNGANLDNFLKIKALNLNGFSNDYAKSREVPLHDNAKSREVPLHDNAKSREVPLNENAKSDVPHPEPFINKAFKATCPLPAPVPHVSDPNTNAPPFPAAPPNGNISIIPVLDPASVKFAVV